MPLFPEQKSKIRNQLKLIEAQAAVLADELENEHCVVWGSDQSRKLGIIYEAAKAISAMSER
jgi:hypothetical protein